MKAVICTLLSGAGFYLSLHLGEIWTLAWLAPVPVLWFAFGDAPRAQAFSASFAAYALGLLNLLEAYGNVLSLAVMLLAIAGPSLCFALAVLGAGRIARTISPAAGVVGFAALWTAIDYALAFGPDGAATSPAYSQVAAVELIQSASVFGLWAVTFTIGFAAAGVAMAVARKSAVSGLLAILVFGLNAGYGVWRLDAVSSGEDVIVGLAADDSLGESGFANDAPSALKAIDAYAGIARDLAGRGATLIVLPEKFAVLSPAWRDEALNRMQDVARTTGATIVAGFDERAWQRLNQAYVFEGSAAPRVYSKRRLVGGLESAFTTGQAPLMLADRTLVAICKDMDFPAMLRGDASLGPRIAAIPAWDFDRDAWAHARMALMRGVENGFAVVRSARQGLLTVSDANGRVHARAQSGGAGPSTLVARIARGPSSTPYTALGDVFPIGATVLAALLLGLPAIRRHG